MVKRHLFCLVCSLVVVLALGCTQGPPRPADMPSLYPCQVKVIQDGKPLEGASVSLTAKDGNVRFTTAGITDKNGIAVIKTDINWEGVPEGKFYVCVSKVVTPDIVVSQEKPKSAAEFAAQDQERAKRAAQTKSVVDKKFLRPNTTPITVDVTRSGVNETVDVGAAVAERLDDVFGQGPGPRR